MIKLYETQSYLRECDATVSDCICRDGKIYVRLDKSIFFPEEGGQYADTGCLMICGSNCTSVRLLDGQIQKDGPDKGSIYYEVSKAVPEGTKVKCILDWEKRYDRMQNHSGEHILSGLVHGKYGYNNVGFHLSDDGYVTLDFDGMLSYEQAIEMERLANDVIYNNMPIKDSYPSKEELQNIEYRSKIEIDGQVRLITIENEDRTVDVCACCAPHVKNTGEIGIIKVASVIKWKKGVQLSIICGRRALEYLDNEHDILMNVARNLSTSPENVWNVVKSHMDEVSLLKAKLSSVCESGLLKEVEALPNEGAHLIFTEIDLTPVNMKNVYNALMSRFENGCVAVFVGDDSAGYRYNAGVASGDARELASYMREKLDAKGGGSSDMIQGRVAATREDIIKALEHAEL